MIAIIGLRHDSATNRHAASCELCSYLSEWMDKTGALGARVEHRAWHAK